MPYRGQRSSWDFVLGDAAAASFGSIHLTGLVDPPVTVTVALTVKGVVLESLNTPSPFSSTCFVTLSSRPQRDSAALFSAAWRSVKLVTKVTSLSFKEPDVQTLLPDTALSRICALGWLSASPTPTAKMCFRAALDRGGSSKAFCITETSPSGLEVRRPRIGSLGFPSVMKTTSFADATV